jgi:hypothetical protein
MAGNEINFEGSLVDISMNKIRLEFLYDFDSKFYHYNIVERIELNFDKNRFTETLLDYQIGDDVLIESTFVNWLNRNSKALDWFELDLCSISKIGSTKQSRDKEIVKKSNKKDWF